ncbi:MAG: SusD/RagB family nutrient-binding outer membrane lipoprotein, partial [Ekhidna sp.]|nr:SusD/RagB family nutrient-binding outer membrane lipoprotein [Ekhidna sp.]
MKKIQYLFSLMIVATVLVGCDLDEQVDPNNLTPADADVDALLNGIQLQFENVFSAAQDASSETMRMENLTGTRWDNAYIPSSFDAMWTDAYAEVLIEERILDEVAVAGRFYSHRGIAKVLAAYTLVTLVDMFGDVPFEEALDATNFVPSPTDGAVIYDAALAMLDTAIANLQRTDAQGVVQWDNFYGGEPDPNANWIKAANTMKLRIHLQRRLSNEAESVAAINALIADIPGNLITTAGEALVFQFSTSNPAPESRHPDFVSDYLGGANEYQSDPYMLKMYTDKSSPDPRMRYYFYRQDVDPTTRVDERGCVGGGEPGWYVPSDGFCFQADGYWGRSHLDNAGIPPDNLARTIYGIYPAGGQFDEGQDAPGSATDGLAGAGIHPILMP